MVDWDYQNTFCSCWVWLAYKRLGVSRLVVLSCSTRIILLIVKHIRCGIEGSYFLLFCYWLLILLIASLALIILLLQDTPLWAYLLTYCVVNNLLRWVKDCKNFVRRRLLISVAKESLPCSLLLLYCKQRMEDWISVEDWSFVPDHYRWEIHEGFYPGKNHGNLFPESCRRI